MHALSVLLLQYKENVLSRLDKFQAKISKNGLRLLTASLRPKCYELFLVLGGEVVLQALPLTYTHRGGPCKELLRGLDVT